MSDFTYDLAVAYRIYPKVSEASLGLPFDNDKLRQAELALRSFKRSLAHLRVKLWAVMDSCPSEYAAMFRRYFDPEDLVLVPMESAGNHKTFAKQIDILMEQTDAEFVYFAEDDYLYLDQDFSLLLRFLENGEGVQFVTPFDHPDDYFLDLHQFPKWVRYYEGVHWRNAASTCLTFLTSKKVLAQYASVFRTYARRNFDASLWISITKYRVFAWWSPVWYSREENFFLTRILAKAWMHCWWQILAGPKASLWVPMPTFALHLNRHRPAPGFDMAKLMLEEDKAPVDSWTAPLSRDVGTIA